MVMKQWGFDGIICTDAGALTFSAQHHYYNSDKGPSLEPTARESINSWTSTKTASTLQTLGHAKAMKWRNST
jgi:hypothetical protein